MTTTELVPQAQLSTPGPRCDVCNTPGSFLDVGHERCHLELSAVLGEEAGISFSEAVRLLVLAYS